MGDLGPSGAAAPWGKKRRKTSLDNVLIDLAADFEAAMLKREMKRTRTLSENCQCR
jgi:hypothetical protein